MPVKTVPSKQDVFEWTKMMLIEALGVDEEEIVPTARIYADLGAESIDRLDLTFRIEKRWGFKISPDDLTAEDILNQPDHVKDGLVTNKGMMALRKKIPHAKGLDIFNKHRLARDLPDLFTVENLCLFIESKLAE